MSRPSARASMTAQHGLTMIELIVAIILVGVMASVLVPLGATAVRAYQTAHARLSSQDKVRYAVERMAREVREVKFDPATGFAFVGALSSNPTSQLTFTRHYYEGAGTASAAATIALSVTGSDLRLSDSRFPAVGSQVLCDNVSSLEFTFRDAAGQVLAAPTALNVYMVDVALTLNSSGSSLSHRTRVELKNRRPA